MPAQPQWRGPRAPVLIGLLAFAALLGGCRSECLEPGSRELCLRRSWGPVAECPDELTGTWTVDGSDQALLELSTKERGTLSIDVTDHRGEGYEVCSVSLHGEVCAASGACRRFSSSPSFRYQDSVIHAPSSQLGGCHYVWSASPGGAR